MRTIDINSLNSNIWINAEVCNNLAFAYVIPVRERARDNNIVRLNSLYGSIENITINDLIDQYTYLNNKKISAFSLRNGKDTLVKRRQAEERTAKFIFVPTKALIKYGDTEREITEGSYIVVIDNNIRVLSPKVFRKTFRVLEDYRNKPPYNRTSPEETHKYTNNSSDTFSNKSILDLINRANERVAEKPNNNYSSLSDKPTNIQNNGSNRPTEKLNHKSNTICHLDNKNGLEEQIEGKSKGYRLIGNIICGGRKVGHILEGSKGRVEVDRVQFIRLLRDKQIENVGLRLRNGKYYMHGIGCKLEDIPDIFR